MKRLTAAILLAAAGMVPAFADYPPAGWTASITDAVRQAQAENKMLLLDFTGSDWCVWCHKLNDEVWSTKEFQDWAKDNVVKVFLDFPKGIEQSQDTQLQNYVLSQALGVEGYPTIWLLDSDLTPLLRTGYREGGGAAYVSHLSGDRFDLAPDVQEKFRTGLKQIIEQYVGPLG